MANVYNKPVVIIGGGSSAPVDNGPIYEGKYRVRYFDADGTILKIEYVESGGKTTPPNNPTYDPDYLIFAEWNYDTYNYIVEQPTDIGAIYDTVDDVTYMFCRFTAKTGLNPTLAISGATSIDWGDGTVDTNTSHTYTKEGSYVIKISGNITFTSGYDPYLLGRVALNAAVIKIYISKYVTTLKKLCFVSCGALEIISLPKTLTSIDSDLFSSNYSLKNIIIPNGIQAVPSSMCYNNYSLEVIVLPNSIKTINENAFSGTNYLYEIVIPSNVTKFYTYLFSCYNLKNIIITSKSTPQLTGSNLFRLSSSSVILWVKDSIIEQLKVATNWSEYASYMKPLSWYPSLTNPNA